MELLIISHALNIISAGSIGILLVMRHPSVEKNFGWDSPARQMFASIYLTIMLVSLFSLLFRPFIVDVSIILFPIQIAYTLLSLFTVRSKRNPIIWINILLSVIHGFSFTSIFVDIFK